jgi:hypothetical protein
MSDGWKEGIVFAHGIWRHISSESGPFRPTRQQLDSHAFSARRSGRQNPRRGDTK